MGFEEVLQACENCGCECSECDHTDECKAMKEKLNETSAIIKQIVDKYLSD